METNIWIHSIIILEVHNIYIYPKSFQTSCSNPLTILHNMMYDGDILLIA